MPKIYSVSQINSYINQMFTQEPMLNHVSISGEVSNSKYHSSGHIYFSLKDEHASIPCVMFKNDAQKLTFHLEDGQQVVADGKVSVYERDGKYQLYASRIRPDGSGVLYERYLALKQELEDSGMFDSSYKKPIPSYVRKLGVVTAPTGAAVRDIINISRRRSPGIQIILFPAKVQGDGAAQSIAEGLSALDELGLDVIIAGRGGGSIEDLWAFNEEIVARAIFHCQTPVISAVGHETDTTIADFVADLRAPTPSAAAELAVPDTGAILEQLKKDRGTLDDRMQERIRACRASLKEAEIRLGYASPAHKLQEDEQRLSDLQEAYLKAMSQSLERKKSLLALYAQKLKNVSPLEKLAQGYACVTEPDGKRVSSIKQVKRGDLLGILVSDGEIDASVQEIKPLKKEVSDG